MFGPNSRNLMKALSARALTTFVDAKASFAHALSAAWLATPLTAVELQGALTSVVEGSCAHSFWRRLPGTARCSVGIGGQASLTFLFDSRWHR